MKRKGILGGIFAMALILVLALALGVGSVSAAEPTIVDSGNCGKDGSNVTWTLDSAGLLTISGTGEMADYEYNSTPWYDYKYKSEIKDAVITDGVTSIGDAAFYYCKGPISVTIPDSVTSIGDNAFAYCKGLTNVTIPDGVTSIGEYAFLGCDNIEKVHIANIAAWCGMVFGNYASNPLKYAKNLYVNDVLVTNLTIPSSVTSIGCYAFYNCTSLTGVTIPDSVKNIGIYAFAGCKGLTSVEIPDSVTSIGDYAFSDCTGLTEVYYNARAVADLTYDSSVFENAGTATDGLKAIFGESVEKIPVALFYDCKGLTSVIIGKNVTSIGDKAFYNCKGLVEISYNAKAAEYSDYFAFNNAGTAARGLKVIFGESVEKIPDGLFYDCTALTGVTIGSNVTSIGDYAFSGCKGLTGIVLPGSVTSIENYAFYNCTGLTSVTIPDSVTSIGYYAFYNCTGLKEIIYNAKAAADLTYDSEVFENAGTAADGMKVVFGESVKKIPAYLFYGANIQKIEFAGDPPVVGNGAWESNRSIYAYYPMHNSAWTNSARIACGSSLVWRGYCYEPLSSGICKINKTVYMTGDTLDDYSISMEVTHKDGCTETIFYDSGLLELGSCDMSTPGAKTIDVIYRGTTAQLKIYVHERKTQTLDKKGYPESSHNY
ncbi:MAG: leucine-rich repeat domain-containing protein [Oscillospiraceae bacterium]|nr:leucine-rich repeat domain-containing protein [Oscillospiraceae bacterium]